MLFQFKKYIFCLCLLFSVTMPAIAADEVAYKISGDMVNFGDALDHKISPDGKWVVFRADKEVNGKIELYKVLTEGGDVEKISGQMIAAGDVSDSYKFSPDSNRVVFRADKVEDGEFDLYSAPIEGTNLLTLTDYESGLILVEINSGKVTNDFEISSDSELVVFTSDRDEDGNFSLYSVPINQIPIIFKQSKHLLFQEHPTKISGEIISTGTVSNFKISPNGTEVVFKASEVSGGIINLYRVPIDGDTPINISNLAENPVSIPIGHLDFKISPNGDRVVYMAEKPDQARLEVYSVSMVDNSTVKLSSLPFFSLGVSSFDVSPDGSRVVFNVPANSLFRVPASLYSVLISGGNQVNMGGTLIPNANNFTIAFSDFLISPNSQRVVFRIDNSVNDIVELYSVLITGGNPERVSAVSSNPFITTDDVVAGYIISPDSRRVVYRTDRAILQKNLFSSPLLAGSSIGSRFIASFVDNDFKISLDSNSVIFKSANGIFEKKNLYKVPITSGARTQLNNTLGADESMSTFSISKNGSHLVFKVNDQNDNNGDALYAIKMGNSTIAPIMPILMLLLLE
jgi:dipeptidyl aminopeptidase/acylaminoacyl peptidase